MLKYLYFQNGEIFVFLLELRMKIAENKNKNRLVIWGERVLSNGCSYRYYNELKLKKKKFVLIIIIYYYIIVSSSDF